MRRLLLATTILATTALANAQGDVSARANPLALLSGSTVTCSATTQVAGCYLERRILTLGDLEVTVGVDAQTAYAGGRTGHLAPYIGLAWYSAAGWSAWGELYAPNSAIPTVGRADWFRLGFTYRLP